jgi:hypothetical protein
MSEYSANVKKEYVENSFHMLFWDQQMKMLAKDPKQALAPDAHPMVPAPEDDILIVSWHRS